MKKVIWILLTVLLAYTVAADSEKKIETSDIVVTINRIQGSEGKISIGLFITENGWPEAGKELIGAFVNISTNTIRYVFREIPNGVYAIAIFHDENMNNKLDKGLFGIPKEGYAFSNNIFGTFGPPTFEDASFAVNENKNIHISLKY